MTLTERECCYRGGCPWSSRGGGTLALFTGVRTRIKHCQRVLIIALLLHMFFGTAVAQSPTCIADHLRLGRASALTEQGDRASALATMDSVFTELRLTCWAFVAATESALILGDTVRATKYLGRVYANGGAPILTYSDPIKGVLARGFHEPELSYLLASMDEWASAADSTWINALVEMKELDQSHRADDALTRHNDSLNLERLITLTEHRGFPSPAIVGSSFGIVELLLWHHRFELGQNSRLDYYCDLARMAMNECQIAPSFLAGLIDMQAWNENKAMPYGSLISYFRNQLDTLHLPELATLNANRASVGLEPMEAFARMVDIPLEKLPIGK